MCVSNTSNVMRCTGPVPPTSRMRLWRTQPAVHLLLVLMSLLTVSMLCAPFVGGLFSTVSADAVRGGPARKLAQATIDASATTDDLVPTASNGARRNRQPVLPTPQLPSEVLPDVFDYASALDADTVTVTFQVKLSGSSPAGLTTSQESRVASITGQLTGTPPLSWIFAYDTTDESSAINSNQSQQLQLNSNALLADAAADRQPGNRRMLLENAEQKILSRRSLQQQDQDQSTLTVSVSVFTSRPHLVVYRLTRPRSDETSASSTCSTVYCSALVNGEVPIVTGSIDVAPNLEAMALKLSDIMPPAVAEGPAFDSDDQQRSQTLAITIGASVGGGVLALLLVALMIRRCRGKGLCATSCNDSDKQQPSFKKADSVKKQPAIEFVTQDHYPVNFQQHLEVRVSAERQPVGAQTKESASSMSPIPSSSMIAAEEEESCTTSASSQATLARLDSNITAPSSGGSTEGPQHNSASDQQTPRSVSIRSRFLRIMSHDSLISMRSTNSSQISTRTPPKSVDQDDAHNDEGDQPSTPKASFYEEEEAADKVLKDIVPPSPDHQVLGGRVIFKVPESDGSASPLSPFSPYSATWSNSTFGSMPGETSAACGRHSTAAAAGCAAGSSTAAYKLPSSSVASLPQDFQALSNYIAAISTSAHSLESLAAHSLSAAASQISADSNARADPQTLYDALNHCRDSLKQLESILTPKASPGPSPLDTPRVLSTINA